MQADTLLADKAVDADRRVILPLRAAGKSAVIPPRRNRICQRSDDKELYKARPPHRELLLQAQAIPSHCSSIPQDCQKLSRRYTFGRRYKLAQLRTGPKNKVVNLPSKQKISRVRASFSGCCPMPESQARRHQAVGAAELASAHAPFVFSTPR
jgi:hypothetical protein